MGMFDQLTVNSFVTHLELACNPNTPGRIWINVSKAFDGLRKIQKKKIEGIVSYEGWKYVVDLSTQLGMVAALDHVEEAIREIAYIREYATKCRDEAFARESDSN